MEKFVGTNLEKLIEGLDQLGCKYIIKCYGDTITVSAAFADGLTDYIFENISQSGGMKFTPCKRRMR